MPRIRKETSNRKKTNDRAKLRKKVREGRKKKSKAAKKNVQWKSKTPKDPGIPNEFPYKDQILAEVAEQRRLAAEDKERKKQEKQRALAKSRAIARGEPFEDSEEESDGGAEGAEDDEDEEGVLKSKKDLNVGAESIASLSAKLVNAQLKPRPRPAADVEEEDEEEEEIPVLINRDLPNLKTVLDKADVVLEVLDARDPLAFRSQHIEELVSGMGKKVLLVLTKIDTCPREAVASWSQHLRSQHPTLLFRSATSFLPETSTPEPQVKKGKGKARVPVDDAVGTEPLFTCLAHWAKEKGKEPLAVAIIGVTNVGKSSLINSLLKRATLPVYTLASSSRGPTTTELPQEVSLDIEEQKVTLIDTPGLSFASTEDTDGSLLEERRARDILLRSKGRIDRLKDPNPPIVHIVSRANAEDLMLLYSLPAFAKGDPTAFLSGVARANQLVKKKGEPDLTGAARIVLRDWSTRKLAHYTTPALTLTPTVTPGPVESSSKSQLIKTENESFVAQLYSKDETILASLPTRKERRKQGGLVKLSSGVLEDRKAAVEEDWAGLEDEEDNEDDSTEDDAAGMDVDEAEEGEEIEDEEEDEDEDQENVEDEGITDEEEEEELTPPPITKKQKRKRAVETSAPERPSKKVAFAPPPSKRSLSESTQSGKHTPIKAMQQKPLKSAQAQSKKLNGKPQGKPVLASNVKAASKSKASPLKVSAGSAATKTVSDSKAKVANVSTKKAKGPLAAVEQKDGGNGPEAYDFGKFF